jgi:hypothetical protein
MLSNLFFLGEVIILFWKKMGNFVVSIASDFGSEGWVRPPPCSIFASIGQAAPGTLQGASAGASGGVSEECAAHLFFLVMLITFLLSQFEKNGSSNRSQTPSNRQTVPVVSISYQSAIHCVG